MKVVVAFASVAEQNILHAESQNLHQHRGTHTAWLLLGPGNGFQNMALIALQVDV